MPSPRPGSVTAAAVLSIIYGSLFTLCGMCAVAGMVGQGAMVKNFFGGNDPVQIQVQNEWEQALQRDVPTYQAFQIGTNFVNLALAVSLLIAGIGLLSMNPWARTLAMTASLLAILSYIFQVIYLGVYVFPSMNRIFQEILPAAMARQGAAGPGLDEAMRLIRVVMTVIVVITVILYVLIIVYLFIIVMLLRRQHVRAAFAAVAAGTDLRPGESEIPPGAYEDDPGWGQEPRDDWRFRR